MILQCASTRHQRFKAREICIEGVEVDPWQLDDVPDHFKGQEMCN